MGRLYHCETRYNRPTVLDRVYFEANRQDYRRGEDTDTG